jgi:hypothetical protein
MWAAVMPQTRKNKDDVYFFEFDFDTRQVKVFSHINNSLIFSKEFYTGNLTNGLNDFYKKDDLIFILDTNIFDDLSMQRFFEIFQKKNDEYELIHSTFWGNALVRLYILNDKLLFQKFNPNIVQVYSLFDNELYYEGTFPGEIALNTGIESDDLILSINNNRFQVRNINDFNTILMDKPLNGLQYLEIHNDHYFIARNSSPNTAHLYYFNIEDNNLSLIHNFPAGYTNTYHEIITYNAFKGNYSKYYTIINGQLKEIGNKFDYREVVGTYFYPDSNKMIQVASSGVWSYEFEFDEYIADDDKTILAYKTELLSNYPNPFNPTTTIKCGMRNAECIIIEVFNIKGQKIKTLYDGYLEVGEHSFVWNGTDDNENSVASGIYFYRMKTDNYSNVKKMILMK